MINSKGVPTSINEVKELSILRLDDLTPYLNKGWKLVTFWDYNHRTVIQREIVLCKDIIYFLEDVKFDRYGILKHSAGNISSADLDSIEDNEFFSDLRSLITVIKDDFEPGMFKNYITLFKEKWLWL